MEEKLELQQSIYQLSVLEDLYAELLTNETDVEILTSLWLKIKSIRKELKLPVFDLGLPNNM